MCQGKTFHGDLWDWKWERTPEYGRFSRRKKFHGGDHVLDVAIPVTLCAVERNGQTRRWVVCRGERLFGCLKDIVDVSMAVVFLGSIIPTSPTPVDDVLVRNLLAPRSFHGTGKARVVFNQMNGRRPLYRGE